MPQAFARTFRQIVPNDMRNFEKAVGAIHDATYYNSRVRVTGFGRLFFDRRGVLREQDWSLRKLKLSAHTRSRSSIVRYLPGIVTDLKLDEVLAPSPVNFNGQVCELRKLTHEVSVGGVLIKRGAEADACLLLPGQGLLVSVGGCAGGWMSHPGHDHSGEYRIVSAGHFGLKSIENGVIPNMAKAMGLSGLNIAHAQAGYAFPIDRNIYEHRWDHPIYGKKNKARCHTLVERYGTEAIYGWESLTERTQGKIDLGYIIRCEFKKLGIPGDKIHGTPSYDSMLGADGKPLWYTTRGAYRKRRNLMIIQHCR